MPNAEMAPLRFTYYSLIHFRYRVDIPRMS